MDSDVAAASSPSLTADEQRYLDRYKRIQEIISGATSIGLYLEFLYSHNHADLQVSLLSLYLTVCIHFESKTRFL
jgi:26S proteasome regulatory subunit N2